MKHVILISTFAVIATLGMSTGCSKETPDELTEEEEATGATLEEEEGEATTSEQTSETEADEASSSTEPAANVTTQDEGTDPTDPPADVAAPPADAEVTASGLAIQVIMPGHGSDHPSPTDTVRVHYTGWTTDGNEFDSSVRRGEPAEFPLNRVIAGWTEGLQLMVEGEKSRLWIPENLAYGGRQGRPAGMLVFEVELLEIVRAPSAPDDVSGPPVDAVVTPSGLASQVLQEGTGTEHPEATDVVMVHYSGWTTDGNMFDSSVTRGQPATFALNRVIAGWTEGLQLMVVGEKRRLWIPEDLAYGGMPGRPAGMLVFDVELLTIR